MYRALARLSTRKIIAPHEVTIEPFGEMWRVVSGQYEFAIRKQPLKPVIYTHEVDTPAAVLKKPGIHILPADLPQLNVGEKMAALAKKVENDYRKAFRNCSTPAQVFHMHRKVQAQINRALWFVGTIAGQKHKHLLLYKAHSDLNAERTLKQYEEKGVEVEALGKRIYPKGHVWMPTSQRYLTHYQEIVKEMDVRDGTVLDIGCGSGILSFLYAKQHKKSRVVGVDVNHDAVETTNINAAELGFSNVEAIKYDILGKDNFEDVARMNQLPTEYDCVVVNPPWLAAKPVGENDLGLGVCDEKGRMLASSLALARRVLKPTGKVVVIHSDLSRLLELPGPTVEELAEKLSLKIEERLSLQLQEGMAKSSPLQQYKNKASILTYLLSPQ